MVEKYFRSTVLVGVVLTAATVGMLSLKVVKVPRRHLKAQSTPVPVPESLDLRAHDSVWQPDTSNLPVTGFVSSGKGGQP